jgi:hypothetical protein
MKDIFEPGDFKWAMSMGPIPRVLQMLADATNNILRKSFIGKIDWTDINGKTRSGQLFFFDFDREKENEESE